MKLSIHRPTCIILAMITSAIGSATAGASPLDVSLNFTSLPSAQGRVYTSQNSPLSETQAFSLNGNALHMNTLGQGFQGSGGNLYVLTLSPFQAGANWELDFTARVTLHEENESNSFGLYIGVDFDNTGVNIGLAGALTVRTPDGPGTSIPFDTSNWHDYRFVADRTSNTYSLFIDSTLKASGALALTNVADQLYIGDGTGGANAEADISSFRVVQTVPEPSSVLLGAVGIIFLGFRRIRNRKSV